MFLGIDCGTQSTKALLIDRNGAPLGRGYAPHALIEAAGGRREQEPQWWVEATGIAVRAAVGQAAIDRVHAIGISGQQHGLVVLDQALQVIRPAKLWNDTETAPENEELLQWFGGSGGWLQRFGIAPLTGYTVSKLLWLRKHEPENFSRIRHILLPHDYLNFCLTGRLVAESGDASGTGFFDPRTRSWIDEVLNEIDGGTGQLVNALPQLLAVGDIVGTVLPEIAASLNIAEGAIVSVGGGDNMMGAIGTGNLRQGVATVSLGTSSTVYSFRDRTQSSADPAIAPFCSSSGGWLPLVCTMNATNVVNGTLALLGRGIEAIDMALDATEPGAGGLTFLAFLNGERTPDLPTATGSLLGISTINFSAENLLRATIEGVTFGVVAGIQRIFGKAAPAHIFAIGGGAKSRAWRQLLADTVGSLIDVPLEEEAACLGAALQAIFTFEKSMGSPETLDEIATRCIQVDEAKHAVPSAEKSALYQAAFLLYQERLRVLYGVT
jgi:xylulokinase